MLRSAWVSATLGTQGNARLGVKVLLLEARGRPWPDQLPQGSGLDFQTCAQRGGGWMDPPNSPIKGPHQCGLAVPHGPLLSCSVLCCPTVPMSQAAASHCHTNCPLLPHTVPRCPLAVPPTLRPEGLVVTVGPAEEQTRPYQDPSEKSPLSFSRFLRPPTLRRPADRRKHAKTVPAAEKDGKLRARHGAALG